MTYTLQVGQDLTCYQCDPQGEGETLVEISGSHFFSDSSGVVRQRKLWICRRYKCRLMIEQPVVKKNPGEKA